MNKLSKERVEQIIASADNIRQAEAPPFLLTRIQARLEADPLGAVVPRVKVGLVFGAAALLVAMNLGAIFGSSTAMPEIMTPQASSVSEVSGYLGLDSYNLGLY